ncbi:hypothetical protein [Parasphingorhabdus halotolerans]|uniref:Uncharacterized protein n=1 Tax=Parasphingorhabdus halotolerans TaxID=2725558 RepID=A0A6H2DJQ0_9SPHN|nr:hypothetical protein [Parasphingorhabdus halotolerans]QJB68564.1 hypothetical protein HF685_04080 [Parasphingorhabdus halotolerans]
MKFNKLASATAAAALVIAPVAAQAADSVAPAVERVSASTTAKGEKLEGENGILIAVLAAAAVIAGIIIIADDNDPTSP